jgi:hypothetical protein
MIDGSVSDRTTVRRIHNEQYGRMLVSRLRRVLTAAAALLSLASQIAQAQSFNPDALNIPGAHPRLLFTTPSDLARARTWYSANTISPRAASAIENAYVGLMTQNAATCRTAINLVLTGASYQLLSDPPPPPPASDAKRPPPVATDPARWIGEEAILTYDWCHAHFTDTERATFKRRWNLWQSVLNANVWGGVGMEENNYFWGDMRNSVLLGLATWGENTVNGVDKAREFLVHGYSTRFLDWLQTFYAAELVGGVAIEGSNYGPVMFDYHVVPFLSMRNMGEDPFQRIRFWRESIYYTAYSMTPARTAKSAFPSGCSQAPADWRWSYFPFADDEAFYLCGREIMREPVYGNGLLAYGQLFADKDSGQLARLIRRTINQQSSPWLRAFFADQNPAPTVTFNQFPLDYFASGTRSLYVRNKWASDASSLSFMFGRSPANGHKHFDAGNIQWWRNGRWLSRESTGYVGSGESVAGLDGVGRVDVNQAVAHNVVLFEGQADINGSYIVSGEQSRPEGNAEMLRLYANSEFAYGAVDLVKSYRYRLGPNRCRYDWPYAQNAVREFVFLRQIETLVMIDRLTGSGDSATYPPNGNAVDCYQNFTGAVRTPSQVVRHVLIHGEEAFTPNNGWYTSNSGAERLAVRPLLPTTRTITPVAERNATSGGGAQGQFRLDIRASGAPTIEFVNVLHASGNTAALPTVSLASEGNDRIVNIEKDGVTHSVRFQMGALPQSTSITINGNTVTPPPTVAPLTPPEFNIAAFDIDGNGVLDAETDGVLITRYMLGLTGTTLVTGALGPGATRTNAAAVTAHLAALHAALDVDGDGQHRASTDGLVINRYLRNVRGISLISNATNGNVRTLEQMLQSLSAATSQ